MHPELIKAMMRMRGVSATDIARYLGVSSVAVHSVIHGKCKSNRIAKVIAKTILKSETDLWPDLYGSKDKKYKNKLINEANQ